jgi:hypothetical protein
MKTATHLAALLAVLCSAGCFFGRHKAQTPPPPGNVDLTQPGIPANSSATTNTFLVTPDQGMSGRVTSVNDNLRFVVLTFPVGQLPPINSRMNVFRKAAIVGEIQITGPQRDNNSVADIIFGDAQKGDEVRMK